jgi:protein-disulfide isomerase
MRSQTVVDTIRGRTWLSWVERIALGTAALLLAGAGPARAQTVASDRPLAEVDGQAITAEEVDRALGAQLQRLEEQIYTLRRQRLDALIAERLLTREAAKRGVSLQALLDAEVTSRVRLVTEQEIETYYQANRSRLRSDEAAAREQVRTLLQSQKLRAQRDAFVRALRSRANVVIRLEAPPVVRTDVSAEGAPARGPATAPVTIVEFSDFHCPFCRQVLPTLTQLMARYGDKVRLVFRDYPIEQLHPGAMRAHGAARCAGDQGKFWPYHDALYAKAPARPEQFRQIGQDTGLDLPAFEECLASNRHEAGILKDLEDGARAGVTGTPTFFINGRPLTGAQSLERFAQIIEDELARAR